MPPRSHFVTDAQFIIIGRRHGCDNVGLESSETSARWNRDVVALGEYGYGQAALDTFEADRSTHTALRAARPESVTHKKTAVTSRDKHVSEGWTWVDKVGSALGCVARTDETLATALATATPVDDAGLETGVQALARLLGDYKAKLQPEAQADTRLAEVADLCAAIKKSIGEVGTTRGQTVTDTEEIDLYDGKLYVWMRDLNSAARCAIRNGHLKAQLSEYTFHHIKHSGHPSPVPPVQPPVPPVQPPATVTPAK
jgi:hypothetical protein